MPSLCQRPLVRQPFPSINRHLHPFCIKFEAYELRNKRLRVVPQNKQQADEAFSRMPQNS